MREKLQMLRAKDLSDVRSEKFNWKRTGDWFIRKRTFHDRRMAQRHFEDSRDDDRQARCPSNHRMSDDRCIPRWISMTGTFYSFKSRQSAVQYGTDWTKITT